MNAIGINQKEAEILMEGLNDLLANYQVFYTNVRGFHWNVRGEKFFELHIKFEELYNDLQLKIDEIAERILTIGGTPDHSFTVYLNESQIKEKGEGEVSMDMVKSVVDSMKILLVKQRVLLNYSSKAEDEGTNALMSDYLREQEKQIWMYNAFMHEK